MDTIAALFSAPAAAPELPVGASPEPVLDPAASAGLTEYDVDPPAFAPAPGVGGNADTVLAGRASASSSAAALAAASAYNNIGMLHSSHYPTL